MAPCQGFEPTTERLTAGLPSLQQGVCVAHQYQASRAEKAGASSKCSKGLVVVGEDVGDTTQSSVGAQDWSCHETL